MTNFLNHHRIARKRRRNQKCAVPRQQLAASQLLQEIVAVRAALAAGQLLLAAQAPIQSQHRVQPRARLPLALAVVLARLFGGQLAIQAVQFLAALGVLHGGHLVRSCFSIA